MNIKEMRELTGQTQKEFADHLGIPVGTIRRWEYGESTPPAYVLRMIAEKIPAGSESLQRIESKNGVYYYNRSTGIIVDNKGTGIPVRIDIEEINAQNLVIYANTLFEAYYEAVDRFHRDCEWDKKEGILWG